MKTINLDNSEIQSLKEIIHEFSIADREFIVISNTLAELEQSKLNLIFKIDGLKKRETLLMDSLKNKYGEGKLNLSDLTYEQQ